MKVVERLTAKQALVEWENCTLQPKATDFYNNTKDLTAGDLRWLIFQNGSAVKIDECDKI